jgi:hypothetical protein
MLFTGPFCRHMLLVYCRVGLCPCKWNLKYSKIHISCLENCFIATWIYFCFACASFQLYYISVPVYLPTFIVTSIHAILNMVRLWIYDRYFLFKELFKPVMTIISCYRQQHWHYGIPFSQIYFFIHPSIFLSLLTAVLLTGLKTENNASQMFVVLLSCIPHYIQQFPSLTNSL